MVKWNELSAAAQRLRNSDQMLGGSSPFEVGDDFPFSLAVLRNAVARRVRAAAPANVDIASAPAAIDGVTMAPDEYVLLPNQTDLTAARIWTYPAAAGQPFTAAEIMAADADIEPAMKIEVAEGATYGGQTFVLASPGPYQLGVTELLFLPVIVPPTVQTFDDFLAGLTPVAPGATKFAVCFDTNEAGGARFVLVATDDLGGADFGAPFDLDTVSAGTLAPDFADGRLQFYVNDGAHALETPVNGYGPMWIETINGASAGAVDFAAYDKITGTFSTIENAIHLLTITRHQNVSAVAIEEMTTVFEPPTQLRIEMVLQQDVPAGFPILIHEDMFGGTHDIWDYMQTDGGDLRAYADEALTTPLPAAAYETDKTGKVVVWRVWLPDAIATGNSFWITVGNAGTPLEQPATDDALGGQNIWQGYQHATHDFDKNLVDDDAWTISGALPAAGPSGLPALGFHTTLGAANTDDVQTDDGSRPTIFTWMGWVNERELAPGGVSRRIFNYPPFEYRDAGSLAEMRIAAAWSGAAAEWSAARPTADAWVFTVIRYDATSTANEPTLRRNKSNIAITETTAPSGTIDAGAGPMTYGNFSASSTVAIDGRIAVPRLVAGSMLPDAYVDAVYDNEANPGAFCAAQAGVPL